MTLVEFEWLLLNSSDFCWIRVTYVEFEWLMLNSSDFCDFGWILRLWLNSATLVEFCDLGWILRFWSNSAILVEFCDFGWILPFRLNSATFVEFCDFCWSNFGDFPFCHLSLEWLSSVNVGRFPPCHSLRRTRRLGFAANDGHAHLEGKKSPRKRRKSLH